MQPLRRLIPIGIATMLLAACSSPSATAPASAQSSPSSATASTDPEPSTAPGAFSCDLAVVEHATVPRANIVDVRVGTHDGFDRVVFEFTDGTPDITLDRATPPFSQDGSGFPVDVEGESFLRLTMRGGTKQMDDGSSSYSGPRDFDPGFPMLVDLVEGGDFEAQSTWYLGLASEACVSVTLLEDEPRLVIDVEH